jgi:hypothetical protein
MANSAQWFGLLIQITRLARKPEQGAQGEDHSSSGY